MLASRHRLRSLPSGSWRRNPYWSDSPCVQQYALAPMDPSTAAAWRDLYIGMVGAGASLTGLTFVAIALDPHQIERTPLLRSRAGCWSCRSGCRRAKSPERGALLSPATTPWFVGDTAVSSAALSSRFAEA